MYLIFSLPFSSLGVDLMHLDLIIKLYMKNPKFPGG